MKEQPQVKKRRKYDPAFKEEALKMVENGRSVSEVSQALGIGENLLYRWRSRQKAKVQQDVKQTPEAPELIAENERLKVALRRAEQERDILKKALNIFSREI